ncbi:cytochrome P450 [Mycena rebaudengoi]|nr:cytochrome P450 [Mycena rebaudengoi]
MATTDGMPHLALVLGGLALGLLSFKLSHRSNNSSADLLDAIPSVGVLRGPLGFYFGAWNYMRNARKVTQEGYDKYPAQAFKVPLPTRWLVIINGRTMIQQFSQASDEEVSAMEAANETMHLEHTVGYEQYADPYQNVVARKQLTRNVAACFPIMRSEMVAAFEDLVPATTDEWVRVPAMETFLQMASRISNRVFIGLECRNQEYIDITTKFAMELFNDAFVLNLVPGFLRPAMKHLEPIIQHRLDMDDKYGANWPEGNRPNDLLTWFIDEAGAGRPERRTPRNLTRKLCFMNLGATHTVATAFLQALYNLATAPEYVEALREEVAAVVGAEGWTKGAMTRMVLLDSFLKETMRVSPGSAIAVTRMVLKDFTFADGTTVPAGTLVAAPMFAEHLDEIRADYDGNYTDAHKFDPFRFARMRTKEGQGTLHQMVALSSDFMVFGLGRHACPGRFFAVNEIKLMLAHVLLTYDVKLRDGMRPTDEWIFTVANANSEADVLFRRRVVDDEPQCQAGKLTEACFEAWIGLLYYKTDMDGINQSKINNCVFRKILHARLLLVFAGRE